jgi:hypothetical protein
MFVKPRKIHPCPYRVDWCIICVDVDRLLALSMRPTKREKIFCQSIHFTHKVRNDPLPDLELVHPW